jgi:hypothetical protein
MIEEVNNLIIPKRKYASHLSTLEIIFAHSNIKDVFEYGCGRYSTKFFIDHANTVTSVEMHHEKWSNRVKKGIALR